MGLTPGAVDGTMQKLQLLEANVYAMQEACSHMAIDLAMQLPVEFGCKQTMVPLSSSRCQVESAAQDDNICTPCVTSDSISSHGPAELCLPQNLLD